MRKNKLNHNRQIMFGIMAMAIVVLGAVIFFWMWCLPEGGVVAKKNVNRCVVSIDRSFTGDSIQMALNDSIVYNRVITEKNSSVDFPVTGAGKLLMVTDVRLGLVVSSEVPEQGGCFKLLRQNGEMVIMNVSKDKE